MKDYNLFSRVMISLYGIQITYDSLLKIDIKVQNFNGRNKSWIYI